MKKVVLITGASSGIGHATAKKYIEEGHIVYGVARRIDLMKDLEDLGAKTFFMDVREDQSVKEGIEKVIQEQGKIDILVNNAAYAQYGALEDVSIKMAKDQFETNVYGYARTIKEIMPHMRENKSGMIINVTSSAGKIGLPIVTWYSSSKFALEGLLDAFRVEASLSNVKVVIIEPGFIDTDLYRVAWKFLDKVKISPIYEKIISAFRKDWEKRQDKAPGPEVIANKIYKAGMSKNPKTRYALPSDAKLYIPVRKILPDKLFDWFVKKTLKL